MTARERSTRLRVVDPADRPVEGMLVKVTCQDPGGTANEGRLSTNRKDVAGLSASHGLGSDTVALHEISKDAYALDPAGSILAASITV